MITVHFIGRVGKDAQVRDGSKGPFLSMDVADELYAKGENVTRWTRIKSSDPNIVKMAKYFTKGKPLEIHGELMKDDEWEDTTTGKTRWQHVVRAKTITFVPGGKKKENGQATGNEQGSDNLPTPPPAVVENASPFPAPDDKDDDDLPF